MKIQIGRDFGGGRAFLAPGVMGLLLAVITPTLEGTAAWGWFALSLLPGFLGVLLLVYAKWPLYRQRKFFSFGSQALPEDRRAPYRWAWRLVTVTICIQVVLIVSSRLLP